jgi:hypothetical protein
VWPASRPFLTPLTRMPTCRCSCTHAQPIQQQQQQQQQRFSPAAY